MSRPVAAGDPPCLVFYHRKGRTSTGRRKIDDGFKTPQARYEAKNVTRVVVKIVHSTESDIMRKLEEVENRSGYIKELIRQDIARSATNTKQ